MEFEKDEIKKIFGFIDNQGRGFLDAYQLQALLVRGRSLADWLLPV